MKNALKKRGFQAHCDDDDWYRSEKLHGANFQVMCDEKEVTFASRRLTLDPESPKDFFYFSDLKNHLAAKARLLFMALGERKINIYGELYGGKIQKEIIYQDEHKYCVFDVLIDGEIWLDYAKFPDLIGGAGLDFVPMVRGTLQDLIKTPVEFKSAFSTEEKTPNAEGYVIKKIANSGKCHLSVKNKAPSFVEAHTGKIIQEREFKIVKKDPLKSYPDLPSYINSNRVSSWYSKGDLKEHPSKVTQGVILDAVKDYMADHEDADEKSVRSGAFSMFQKCQELVKAHVFE